MVRMSFQDECSGGPGVGFSRHPDQSFGFQSGAVPGGYRIEFATTISTGLKSEPG
jgi:hypothetical protein